MSNLTTVPFSGFYYSWHDESLDHALDTLCSDESGCHPYSEIRDRIFNRIDWNSVHRAYAKKYCQLFAAEYGIDLRFESLTSPKYYNFETDRIFAHIDDTEVARLYDAVNHDDLRKLIRERFTSCSGFISHYPNTLESWGPIDTWDHNQIGTLVEVYAIQELGRRDEPLDMPILQGDLCAYEVLTYNMGDDPEIGRLLNLVDYLNRRSQRQAA